MKKALALLIILIAAVKASAQAPEIVTLAKANGYSPSTRVVKAIAMASKRYGIPASELTAIAILETGLGNNVKTRNNANGTQDLGLFQINTINQPKCVEYNLASPEGSALCAAKLLNRIRKHRADYLGVYHSKTPVHKDAYIREIQRVLGRIEVASE